MSKRYGVVQWFADLDQNALAIAGGKGANLGELQQMGMPVPAGFVITTGAYQRFVETNQLQERIVELAKKAGGNDPIADEAISAQIHDLFMGGTMPDELSQTIQSAYEQLMAEGQSAVAVRSSATAEDLPSASFAGQQDTYLNITGAQALSKAVKSCWASLWTARAISYRAVQQIDPASVTLAVVVQKMAQAEAAGILFTANPVNGQRGQAVIDAAWGLGEAIVSGQVTPDHWVIDKKQGKVLSTTTADKSVMTVRTATGTEEMPVPDDKRKQPAITAGTALKLAEYGTQIEQHYQRPMDIEWAIEDGDGGAGHIAILQARPITALPEPVADPPSTWPLPFEGATFVRGSITEQLPDPLSPLFATLAPAEMTKSLDNLYWQLANKHFDGVGFTIINGYVYIFVDMTLETWLPLLGTMTKFPEVFRTGTTIWRDKFRPLYQQSIATWQAKVPKEMKATELLDGARELLYRGTELYTGVQFVIPVTIISEQTFTAFYDNLVKGPGDPPAQTFLIGFDSQPIFAEKALYDLAMWSREQPVLSEVLRQTPAEKMAGLLATEQAPSAVPDEIWQSWRSRVHAYFDQYGHTIYNMDFVNPVPADAPTPIFEILKFYLEGQGTNPYRRQQEAVIKREQATQAILARLDPLRAAIFQKLLDWAQGIGPVREDALAGIGLGWPLLRQLLLELGSRLVNAGAVAQANDIFWLEKPEVERAATVLDAGVLDSGQAHLDSFATLVEERKMEWRGRKRATPPQILPEKSAWTKFGLDRFMPAVSTEQSGPVIKGIPVGNGKVTATARVLHGPEDFSTMQAGDILVAGITTPAWTPLFVLASGIVTDVGGPMSHSSIVAREYGIPAVLGTGVATKRIHSGQSIRVDGDAGTVTLLDELGENAPGEATTPKEKSSARRTLWIGLAAGAAAWLFIRWRRRRKKRA